MADRLSEGKKASDFEPAELARGIKEEMEEHGMPRAEAEKTAMDHLSKNPKYYTELKASGIDEQKKCETGRRPEVTPDGKIELDYGKESLDKEPGKRWQNLKKKLDADKAFMSLAEDDEPDQNETEQDNEGQTQEGDDSDGQDDSGGDQGVSDEGQDQMEGEVRDQAPEGGQTSEGGQSDEEGLAEIAQHLQEEGYSEAEIMHIVHGHIAYSPTADDHEAANEQLDGAQDRNLTQREADAKHLHQQRLQEIEARKKEAEASIVDPETAKAHAKRLKDLEYETAKKKLEAEDHDGERAHKAKLREIELAGKQAEIQSKSDDYDKHHKRRMADLEYSKAQRESSEVDPTNDLKRQQMEFELEMDKKQKEFEMEMDKKTKELELKYKEKELQLNLRLKEEAAKMKSVMQEEQMAADHEVNMQIKEHQAKHKIADAKKPPEKKKGDE